MTTLPAAPAVESQLLRRFARLPYLCLAGSLLIGAVAGILVVKLNQPIYFLLGVITVAACAVAAFSAEFGLLVLVFMSYTRLSDIVIEYYNAPSIAKAYIAVLALGILIRWLIFKEHPRGWIVPTILLAVYGLLGFASILYSPVPDLVLVKASEYVKNAAITILVIILLQDGKSFRHVIWTLIAVGIFLGSISVFQYFTHTFTRSYGGFGQSSLEQIVGTVDDYRIGGPIGDPNFFAQIMIVLVPISLERALHEKRILLRALALWALGVSFLCVIFTYSRGGLLALLACLAVWFVVNPPRGIQLPLVIIGTVLVLAFVIPPGYYDRVLALGQIFQSQGTLRTADPSLQGRASENLAAWDMFSTHPLFGVGWNSYPYLFPFYSKDIGLAIVATQREAHDLYLEVAAETGVVGLVAFGLMLFSSLRVVVRSRRQFIQAKMTEYAGMTTAFGVGFLGYLVAAIFIHGAFLRYFHVLLGIAWGLYLVAQHTLAERSILPSRA
jgi:putative inorganic carbon (HCO3(-)) transporter